MFTRKATATWNGNLKQGDGTMRYAGAEAPFTFATRFEGRDGASPEDLIGAAHAGCFSMAFSNMLDQAGHTANSVQTTATVHFDTDEKRIARISLECEGDVPGISDDDFQRIAGEAKDGCPISKTLIPCVEVEVDARLV
jgi:lipoyl-dependent peroxiredoxin